MLNLALNQWYSGDIMRAQLNFLQLFKNLDHLPLKACQTMGAFFYEQKLDGEALACFEHFLNYQFDEESMKRYTELLVEQPEEIEQLYKFLELYESELSEGLAFSMLDRLAQLGTAQQAYLFATRLLVRIEWRFEKSACLTTEHVALTEWIVTYDVQQGNFTQARYQLRKLLCAEMTIVGHDNIIKWAISLDLVGLLLVRRDFRTILENCMPEYKKLLEFYVLLKQQKASHTLATELNEAEFQDEWLQDKVQAIVQMIQLLLKKGTDRSIIAQLYTKRPYDLLIAKLYTLYFEPTTESFWSTWLHDFDDLEEGVKWYRKYHPTPPHSSAGFEVAFLGGGEKIGGTAILVKMGGRSILLDAGMFLHEDNLLTNFSLLQQHGLTPADLDAVFVSHAHLDHTGSLPYISKVAPTVPIYATAETAKLMQILLRTVVEHEESPPYSEHDIGKLYLQIEQVRFNEKVQVGDWCVTFLEAGHIIGAASLFIEIAGKNLLFTGDISVEAQLTCGVFSGIDKPVDVLITESTYGYLPQQGNFNRKQQQQQLLATIEQTVSSGGTCLIPTFAVGRSQEVLSILQQHYDGFFPYPVIVDGGVLPVCDIYESTTYFELSEQVMNAHDYYKKGQFQPFFESNAQGAVVIASSGMLYEGSASSDYAYALIDDPNSTIIYTGYLDAQSPAYALFRLKEKRFKIGEKNWKDVQAKQKSISLSAHIQRDDLLQLIHQISPKTVMLMHGEHEKRFRPIHSTVSGEVIYPSIVEMLSWSKINTICAKNNETYQI